MDGFLNLPFDIIINIIIISNDISELNKWIKVAKILYLSVMSSKLLWDHYLHRDFDKGTIRELSLKTDTDVDIYKRCSQLTKLLSFYKNKKLGVKNISELWNLRKLSFSNYKITKIPAAFGGLANLEILYIEDNKITEIPATFGELANLRRLSLRNNQITEIPAALRSLTNLQELSLGGNQIINISEDIEGLANLRRLYLHNNKITEIPATFGNLTNLLELSISNNQITKIPDTFGSLINLQE